MPTIGKTQWSCALRTTAPGRSASNPRGRRAAASAGDAVSAPTRHSGVREPASSLTEHPKSNPLLTIP
jgi:hypothetical protein